MQNKTLCSYFRKPLKCGNDVYVTREFLSNNTDRTDFSLTLEREQIARVRFKSCNIFLFRFSECR